MSVNGIEVTDVIVFPTNRNGRFLETQWQHIERFYKVHKKGSSLKAYVKIILNDNLIINGLMVIQGRKGPFVSFPQREYEDGKMYDVCFPITTELRMYIVDQVLSQYSISLHIEEEA